MSTRGSRRLRWLLPLVLGVGAFVALALHPGADLEPEVRRFLASIDAGTTDAVSAHAQMLALWDPAELQSTAEYLRKALGPLASIEELGDTRRIEAPRGLPGQYRRVQATLRYTRSQLPVPARFDFIRTDAGWSVCDFEIAVPRDVPSQAPDSLVPATSLELAGEVLRHGFDNVRMRHVRAARRAFPEDEPRNTLLPAIEGLPMPTDLHLVSREPAGEGTWRTVVRAAYPEGQAREVVMSLAREDGRWRLLSLAIRVP
ncbi:MAG: hypothetical protein ACKOCB_03790 [Planctomycetia bacterium]